MKNKGKQGMGGSPYMLDRNITPRIEQYALNHDITDIDDVVDHLRRSYKEYQRKQVAALRQMVVKAVQVVQQKGVSKPELQLQARENQHVAARGQAGKAAADSSSEGEGSSDERGSESDEEGGDGAGKEGGDLDAKAAADLAAATAAPAAAAAALTAAANTTTPAPAKKPNTGLNSSLLNMYSTGKQAAAAAGGGSSSDSSSGDDDGSGSDSDSQVDPNAPPAFAPPHVIAAAAARALAAEKAEKAAKAARKAGKAGKQQQQQQDLASVGVVAAAAAAGAVVGSTVPAAAAAADDPAAAAPPAAAAAAAAAGDAGVESASAAKQKKSRSAEEAGIGRDSRAVSKRARRVSAAPGSGGGGGGAAAVGLPGSSKKGASAVTAPRALHYADLGGVDEVLSDIRELIEYPLKHPEVYGWLGVEPPRGVLLHGPPGCGKTALAHAIACECGVPFLRVSAPEVVSGMSGESEARLRQLFQEAQDVAPSIIFIDEIDAIAPKRDTAQREMERRIVAQMLTCMDDLSNPPPPPAPATGAADPAAAGEAAAATGDLDASNAQQQQRPPQRGHVVVIGATNRPDALDPALRRAGRFDREIALGIPTEAARQQILRVLTRSLRLQGGFDFGTIARRTPGFVGADLAALTKEAAAVAVSRIFRQLDEQQQQLLLDEQEQATTPALSAAAAPAVAPADPDAAASADVTAGALVPAAAAADQPRNSEAAVEAGVKALSVTRRLGNGPLSPAELAGLAISMADFEAALPKVQPSVRREGFTTKPDATWEDVGSLEEVREELSFSISQPIAHPEAFAAMGLSSATGVLLYGPPGCGKTLVAKAVAAESGANFISIKGPELLNKYVGESERAVRQLFARARAAHPCVLFFDEMDALAPRRGSDNNAPAERLVNQLLTEMDGIDGRLGVYVVAATNRPDMIDPALLRPGRLDKVLYVPLPPPDGRASILAAAGRRTPMAPGVPQQAQDLVRSERCEGFSGADVAALVKEAAVLALKEAMSAAAAAAAAAPAPAPAARPAAADPSQLSSHAAAAAVPAAAHCPLVYLRHFELALVTVTPSVSKRDRRSYEAMRVKLRGARAHIPTAAAASAGEAAGVGGLGGAAGDGENPQASGMEAEDAAAAAAAAAGVRRSAGGDEMEGTDDAPEPEDPMKD